MNQRVGSIDPLSFYYLFVERTEGTGQLLVNGSRFMVKGCFTHEFLYH